ncbi:hypothetical protein MTO96_036525, partial [Rhipicephalus appendiculatus]
MMERTLEQRARIYSRDTNITSLDILPPVFGNSMQVRRELVRSVVREELQKQRLDQNAPMLSSLADVIREEVRQVRSARAEAAAEQNQSEGEEERSARAEAAEEQNQMEGEEE